MVCQTIKGMKITTYFFSVLQSVMFNSMPVDMMETNGNKTEKQKKNSISSDAKLHEGQIRQRIEMLLKYLRKYGVPEKHLFEVHELQEMSNIPKVTRCIAMLGKMVRKHKHTALNWPKKSQNLTIGIKQKMSNNFRAQYGKSSSKAKKKTHNFRAKINV